MDKKELEKMEFSKYRSGTLVNGIERAAHRALLYSTGLDADDFKKSSYSNPTNRILFIAQLLH